ncbi:MAG: hypothetical protein NTW87_21660 [Planctomycetota bacterium]|nr:hypothetical protein [Planctomycetota bacterium]
MSDAPRKRPSLQFSLATAIVMMLVAGGILWLNMRIYRIEEELGYVPTGSLSIFNRVAWRWDARGWPVPWCKIDIPGSLEPQRVFLAWYGVAMDACVAIAILIATAVILEWRIRRKERAHD